MLRVRQNKNCGLEANYEADREGGRVFIAAERQRQNTKHLVPRCAHSPNAFCEETIFLDALCAKTFPELLRGSVQNPFL